MKRESHTRISDIPVRGKEYENASVQPEHVLLPQVTGANTVEVRSLFAEFARVSMPECPLPRTGMSEILCAANLSMEATQ